MRMEVVRQGGRHRQRKRVDFMVSVYIVAWGGGGGVFKVSKCVTARIGVRVRV